MKSLGLLFILGGIWLCWTVVFWLCGVAAIAAGALLCIAGRGPAPRRLARAVQLTLGGAIALSVVAPAVVFFVFALGYGPGQHPAPPAAHQLAPVPQPSPARGSASHHAVTHKESCAASVEKACQAKTESQARLSEAPSTQ